MYELKGFVLSAKIQYSSIVKLSETIFGNIVVGQIPWTKVRPGDVLAEPYLGTITTAKSDRPYVMNGRLRRTVHFTVDTFGQGEVTAHMDTTVTDLAPLLYPRYSLVRVLLWLRK